MQLAAGWYIRVWVDFTGSVEIYPLLIVGKPFKDSLEYVYTVKVAGNTCYYYESNLCNCTSQNMVRRLYPFSNKLLNELKSIKGPLKMIEKLTKQQIERPALVLARWDRFRSLLKDT